MKEENYLSSFKKLQDLQDSMKVLLSMQEKVVKIIESNDFHLNFIDFLNSNREFKRSLVIEPLLEFNYEAYISSKVDNLNVSFLEWYKLHKERLKSNKEILRFFTKRVNKIKSNIKHLLSKSHKCFDARIIIRSFIQKSFCNRVEEEDLLIISSPNLIYQKGNNYKYHVQRKYKNTIHRIS